MAHYLGESCMDVIVYDKIAPSALPKFIELYADCGYSISEDSVIVPPSQYYPEIIPNVCNEFDDIPEEALAAAVLHGETKNYRFPNHLNMFYLAYSKYNTLTFTMPII